jgi:hypothetical protein
MEKIIELFNKVADGNGNVNLIAECNVYDNGVRVAQLSRSPFTYPDTMTDQEIIDDLQAGAYSNYF